MPWTTIDEMDPGIKYSGSWINTTDIVYFNTLTGTFLAGDTATLNFTGRGIFVYGSIFTNNLTTLDAPTVDPVSNYTIDFGIPYQYTGRRQAQEQRAQNFFRVSNLTASPHTLVITNMVNQGWLLLDYFTVYGDISESTTVSLSSTTFTPSASTAGAAIVTVTAHISGVTVTTQVSGKHTNPVIGAPIGGAIAGFAVVCLIFLFLFSRRRRQKKALQLPTTQSTLFPSYPELTPVQQRLRPSNITPFVVGEPSQSTLPPYPESLPTQQRQHASNITPFVIGESSHQLLAGPSQPTTKQGRTANENGSEPAPEGVVAPSYTKNPVPAGERQASAGERLFPFYLEPSPHAQQQRPSNITPFIVGEPSQEPSEPNASGRVKQGHNANENGSSPAPEGVVAPSYRNFPVPAAKRGVSAGERRVSAGERRVSDGERPQVADLPPAYTVLPEMG